MAPFITDGNRACDCHGLPVTVHLIGAHQDVARTVADNLSRRSGKLSLSLAVLQLMPDETATAAPRPPEPRPAAPQALLERLATIEGMGPGRRRLVVVWGQLGDFDSLEYAQALVPRLPELEQAGVVLVAFGIGNEAGRERFCGFTGFPKERLVVEAEPTLHRTLGLYPGLQLPIGPWGNLLLMCAGIGSPGTLKEVLRGYTGDRSAPQRIADDEVIHAPPLPPIRGSLFARAGGTGFQRPFELATIRLRNMGEVLGHWRTYVPRDDFLTQRGGTFLLDADDTLLVEHRDQGILGFSETMSRPMQFLEGLS